MGKLIMFLIGTMVLGFMFWALYPTQRALINITNETFVNSTLPLTTLEFAIIRLVPLLIPLLLFGMLVWWLIKEKETEQ